MSDNAAYPPMALGAMSWTELAGLRDRIELVLIPIGSTEQHGPHLGLGQDHLIAQAFCERAARRLAPRLLALPAIPWGISDHHMNFAGSMTLRPETFMDLLEDVVLSMRHHGFRRFLIVNGHGGNEAFTGAAVQELGLRLDIDFLAALPHYTLARDTVKETLGMDGPTHACEVEASHAYYLAPDLIRADRLTKAELDEPFNELRDKLTSNELEWVVPLDAITANGALDDARRGSRAAGQRIIEAAIDDLADIVEFLRSSNPRWNGPPHKDVHVEWTPQGD